MWMLSNERCTCGISKHTHAHKHAPISSPFLAVALFLSLFLSSVLCYSQLGDSTGLPLDPQLIGNHYQSYSPTSAAPYYFLTSASSPSFPSVPKIYWCVCVSVCGLTKVPPATALPKYWQSNLISLPLSPSPPHYSFFLLIPPLPFQVSDVIPSSEPWTTSHLAR